MTTLADLGVKLEDLSPKAQEIMGKMEAGIAAIKQMTLSEEGRTTIRETFPILQEKFDFLGTLIQEGIDTPGVVAQIAWYAEHLGTALRMMQRTIQAETQTLLKEQGLLPDLTPESAPEPKETVASGLYL